MAGQKPVKPTAADIARSENLWNNFTKISKYATIGVAVTLILMAIFLV